MTFHSILFERAEDSIKEETLKAPDFFVDLNLDQIVGGITIGKQDYHLEPFFFRSLTDVRAIEYRHGVMQALEDKSVLELIKSFAQRMDAMREHLAQADKLYYKYQKESWFLDAVEIYCEAVNALVRDLSSLDLKSRGLLAFREYLTGYTRSDRFTSLLAETNKVKADLSTVRYCLVVRSDSVTVRKYEGEIDYSTEVEATFEKFKQGAVKDYKVKFRGGPAMNHVEAGVLDSVAKLYPDVFAALDEYRTKNNGYLDETIGVFDREIQFYVAYLDYIAPLKRTGLNFCYPKVSDSDKQVYDNDGFDLALAYKLFVQGSSVVHNSFYLKGQERMFVVTGPNQGGKTTFARVFGQLHFLASIGCPVPGTQAQLFLFDRLFTHFEREEDVTNLRGKLQDDLFRIHDILQHATPNSIIIINEIFNSTTLADAVSLAKKVLTRITELGVLCVCVTFLDELTSLNEATVSMVSTVAPDNPAVRTFKIMRRPADGLSYAISIAEKYGLTYDVLKERIKS